MVLSWQEDALVQLSLDTLEWTPVENTSGTTLKGICYVQVPEGVYMCGGADEATSARVYHSDGKGLSTVRPMLQARMGACGIHQSDYVYVFGGYNLESEIALKTCERYSLDSLKWSPLPMMTTERRDASCCVLNNSIYLISGRGQSSIEVFSLDSFTWSEADIMLNHPVSNFSVYVFPEPEAIILLGGRLDDGTLTSAVYKLDFVTGTVMLDGELEKGFVSAQDPVYMEGDRLMLVGKRDVLVFDFMRRERRRKRMSTIGEKTQIRMDEVTSTLSKELASMGIMGLSKPEQDVTVTLPPRPLIFVVKRTGHDDSINLCFQTLISELLERGAKVLVENSSMAGLPPLVHAFDLQQHKKKINLLVTLGGDGTVIWAVQLFKAEPLPAILTLHMGSLGFLTYYSVQEGLEILRSALSQEELRVDLKKRLDIWTVVANGKKVHKGVALNEVVIDRGSTGTLLHVDCYMNGEFFTTAFADGILIATPSGSTAYSLAAGGSIVHHDIPCLLFTPICPHSLSFRPILFPEKVMLAFMIPDDARSTGMVSIDGGRRFELAKRITLEVVLSAYPAPFISEERGLSHWMKQLKSTIKWNKRKKQKPLILHTDKSDADKAVSNSPSQD